jgi:hypothetical protein
VARGSRRYRSDVVDGFLKQARIRVALVRSLPNSGFEAVPSGSAQMNVPTAVHRILLAWTVRTTVPMGVPIEPQSHDENDTKRYETREREERENAACC